MDFQKFISRNRKPTWEFRPVPACPQVYSWRVLKNHEAGSEENNFISVDMIQEFILVIGKEEKLPSVVLKFCYCIVNPSEGLSRSCLTVPSSIGSHWSLSLSYLLFSLWHKSVVYPTQGSCLLQFILQCHLSHFLVSSGKSIVFKVRIGWNPIRMLHVSSLQYWQCYWFIFVWGIDYLINDYLIVCLSGKGILPAFA